MDEPIPGTLINGRYRIEKELGRGGFGVVFLARDQLLMERAVVVKVLLDNDAGDGWYRRKFEQEIQALSRIHHPGVVSVVDAGELAGGKPFMVIEFVEGSTLRDVIQPGGMDLRRVARIIRRAGHALAAAHDKGVVHRDLKPDNIMLRTAPGGDEHLTIIDFGIASVADKTAPEPEKTKVTGTFTYMAPEQFDGEPQPASDVYALGIIAFEMLAGAPPSAGKPLFELMLMQKEGNWPNISDLRPSVPEEAEAAIRKALARDPQERFGGAREFADTLADALDMAPGTSQLLLPSDLPSRRSGARRRWIVLAFLAAAVAVAVGVFWVPQPWFSSKEAPTASTLPPGPPERLFTYWFTAQRFMNGKEQGSPFIVARETTFQGGDKITLDAEFGRNGYFYAINQAPELRNGLPLYVALFPSLYTAKGSPQVKEGHYLKLPENDRFQFTEGAGSEYVWLIFSTEPLSVFAGLKPGVVKEESRVRRLMEFFETHKDREPMLQTDEHARRTVVLSDEPISVFRIVLTHK